jgi:DNA-binding NarL/FixJ family response regulator
MTAARGRELHHSPAEHASRVIVVTWRDAEADVRDALQSGIGGYLLGNSGLDELRDAVRTVGRGAPYLCEIAAPRFDERFPMQPSCGADPP